jgi:integrase
MSKPNVHGLPQHLRKDEGGYYLDYLVQEEGARKRKRVRLGQIPLEKAKRILAQHMQAIVEERFFADASPQITFNEAADAFMAYSESRKKSFKQDRMYVRNLKAFFGDRLLESVNLDMVEKYLNWRRREGNKHPTELMAATLNRDLACLKTIVRRAKLNRQIDRNPIEGIKLFKENARDRTLTPEEYQKLVQHSPAHLKPMIELAYFTAMRKGEIMGLKWGQVDFQNGVILLEAEDTKTQEKREIPMDENLKEILRRIPKTLGCPYVFSHRGKKLKHGKTAFKRACEKAGLKGFHFHDLRHCAVTNMRKAGVPEGVIMSISGHKTHAVFRRYDRIDRVDRQAALERVRSFNDANKTLTRSPKDTYKTRADLKPFKLGEG